MRTDNATVDLSVLRQVLGTIPNAAEWKQTEIEEVLPFGGSLTKRGWICTHCGFFRRKRNGMSKYCEECGYAMKGEMQNE